jgi:hypothetical protein
MTIDTTNESYFSKRKNIGEIRKFWLAWKVSWFSDQTTQGSLSAS